MMGRKLFTVILFVILGAVYIFLKRNVAPWTDVIFKALPLLLLMIMLCLSMKSTPDKASTALPLAALFFSFLGDSAGEVPFLHGDKAFIFMMLFFAIAQILYTVSFVRYADKKKKPVVPLLILAYFIFFIVLIQPNLPHGAVRAGMYVYMTLIMLMGISASMQNRSALPLFIAGALFFIISDSILAYSRFVTRVPGRDILVMGTYYAAQLLLNISLIKEKQ